MPTVLLVDAMPGVRSGLRWVLAGAHDISIVGEAATVAEARRSDADVVVAGVQLADGTAADLADRPLVVHTWLPDDERDPRATAGAAAIVRTGQLRAALAAAISDAAGR